MTKSFQIISTIIVGLLISFNALAQQNVKGTITDPNGEPLAGVTILEVGTFNGVASDANGKYSIDLSSADAILEFSFIGFKNYSQSVGTLSQMDVLLEEDQEQLNEVIVTALGFKSKRDELGYANSVVNSEQIAKSGESSLLNSLAAKSSGVRISRNSGDPGAGSYIQIRGLSTITSDAQPLIVVDGVPISNDTRGNGSGRIAQQSRLNDINPNDIESVTVLKGASAAALWGTQALGGVIVITTKSGQYNQKLKVSIKSTYSTDVINVRYPLQTKYGQGNNGTYNSRARDSWGDKISERAGGGDEFDTTGEYYVDQAGNIYYPTTSKNSQTIYDDSNFDQIFQNGSFWENNISLSGGNANSTAFFSISDMDQKGIIRNNSNYRRTTVRFNGEHRLADKLLLNANINYSRTTSDRVLRGATSSGLYLGLLRTPGDFDNTGYRGDYYSSATASPISNRHRSYREPIAADGTPTYNNPSWTIYEQEDIAKVDRFINTFKFTYSPTNWIDLIARAGIDQYSEKREEFYTPGSAAGAYSSGYFNTEIASNKIFNTDIIAKASRAFGENFDTNLLVGFNFNHKKRSVNGNDMTNFVQFTDLASGTRDIDNSLPENRGVTSSFGQERTVGVYSSLSVSAYDMIFFNATIRGEAASTFGDNTNNTFYFPSTSIAWQFSELLNVKAISFGKLRASYGEVGVQPQRYNTSNNYVSANLSDEYGGSLDFSLYGNGGFVPSSFRGSAELRPERKKEIELGADFRFLHDRLSLSGTYFRNKTEDVLLDFPVAHSRGYREIYSNGAEITNEGSEFDLGYKILDSKDLSWQVNLIFSSVNNIVTNLAGVENINLGGLSAVNSRAVEGEALGVLWGSRTLRDDDGNIVYDAFGFPEQDVVEGVIGDPNPDWQGALSTGIRYKNFTLSAIFETYQGADIFAGTKSVLNNLGRWEASGNETSSNQNLLDYNGNIIPMGTTFRGDVKDFGAGPVALTEPWYIGDGGFFSNGNDELYIEDGSWTRLREATLSYSLIAPWLKEKVGLTSVEVSATGRNLLLWTKFEGNDPDTNLSGVSSARGIDYFNNPSTKSFIFTLLLNF